MNAFFRKSVSVILVNLISLVLLRKTRLTKTDF